MITTLIPKGFTQGLVTVLGPARSNKTYREHRQWRVKCECGQKFTAWGYNLIVTDEPLNLGRGTRSIPVNTCGGPECRKIYRSRDTVKKIGGLDRRQVYVAETHRIRGELARMGVKERT